MKTLLWRVKLKGFLGNCFFRSYEYACAPVNLAVKMADDILSKLAHLELREVVETGKLLGKGAYGEVIEMNFRGLKYVQQSCVYMHRSRVTTVYCACLQTVASSLFVCDATLEFHFRLFLRI